MMRDVLVKDAGTVFMMARTHILFRGERIRKLIAPRGEQQAPRLVHLFAHVREFEAGHDQSSDTAAILLTLKSGQA